VFIDDWQWDDGNLDELARHHLDEDIVEQVAEQAPRFRANKHNRAATHQMIGPDRGGRIWLICIAPVPGEPGVWRAITGWVAEQVDQNWYWGNRRRP
jgi:hypothetical protein